MKLSKSIEYKISVFQQHFNESYPYLKIQVDTLEAAGNDHKSHSWDLEKPININIDKFCTVAEVERNFAETFGITGHIFRKSSGVWVATSFTSQWTLEKQNREGEHISSLFTESKEKSKNK